MNLDVIAAVGLVVLLSLVGLALWRPLVGRAPSLGRRVMRLSVVLAVAVALTGFGAYRLMNARSVQLLGHQVASIETDEKIVALTFDDGPTDRYVEAVLAALGAYRARGTFFVVGAAAQANQSALSALVAAGHEIGNHSFTHRRLVFVSVDTVAREVESTDRVIRSAGYRGPILFRPPFGKRLLSAPFYLRQNARTTVMWNLEPDSLSAIADDPQAMAKYVADNVRPGSIVLLHVWSGARAASRVALPLILEALTGKGYRVVGVSELLDGT
ncbi:MAG: polysaccharide deacetylase family protein [Actinobacteria bacterium]|nr:polysaccharide deacetylase family protein [Actinomycetota bacterium]